MGAYMNALREEGSRDDILQQLERQLDEKDELHKAALKTRQQNNDLISENNDLRIEIERLRFIEDAVRPLGTYFRHSVFDNLVAVLVNNPRDPL